MKYLSVCSGIEAVTAAWNVIPGWKPAAFSEIEPFPCEVLAHHYPKIPNVGDIHNVTKDKIKSAVDLLVGGTPCQDFSVAGQRAGMDGERSGLAREYIRILAEFKPRWFVWENVPGVLSSNGGRDFRSIVNAFSECGYGCAWRTLDAQYVTVDGYVRAVPQRRERVFVVGYIGDWRPAAAVLFESAGMRGDIAPGRKAGEEIAGTLENRSSGGGGFGTDFESRGGVQAVAGTFSAGGAGPNDPARAGAYIPVFPPLRKSQYCDNASQEGGLIPIQSVADPLTASWHKSNGAKSGNNAGMINPVIAFNHDQSAKTRSMGESYDICPSLRSGGSIAVSHSLPARHDSSEDGLGRGIPLITNAMSSKWASGSGGPSGDECQNMIPVQAATAVRRLTPRECERLMGFPDDYTLIPRAGGKLAADSPRYKALGNSMCVNVMRWIGRRIDLCEEIIKAMAEQWGQTL